LAVRLRKLKEVELLQEEGRQQQQPKFILKAGGNYCGKKIVSGESRGFTTLPGKINMS
jgi:hypothetical protein